MTARRPRRVPRTVNELLRLGYVLSTLKIKRLRSLLARDDRALIGPRNPDVVARLFGGRFDAWATFPHQRLAGVPDPAFWLVMEYWRLGDWRRPRA